MNKESSRKTLNKDMFKSDKIIARKLKRGKEDIHDRYK